jgi:hypothetical protein
VHVCVHVNALGCIVCVCVYELLCDDCLPLVFVNIICVADWEKGSFGIRRSKVNFCTDLLPQSLHYLNPRGGSQKFSI